MKSIFIMSSERSGSNLVREMLNAHPNISAPPAAQMPRILTSYLPYYGDLQPDAKIKQVIEDALALSQTHPVPLEVQASVDELLSSLPNRTIWGVISTLYAFHAKSQGKDCWASKDNYLFNYAFAIKQTLPEARFLYLVRDGRDYACSMLRVGTSSTHIYSIAKQWQQEQQACLQVYNSMRESNSVHLLRYEDLLADPVSALQRVCAFLDEPFNSSMLSFYDQGSAQHLATQSAFWENLSKPVLSSNTGKFITQLSRGQLSLFEKVAGRELTLFGYPRMASVEVGEPSSLFRMWYLLQGSFTKALKIKRLVQAEQWRDGRQEVINRIQDRLLNELTPIINSNDPV